MKITTTAHRVALPYLGVIMAVSIAFSVALYNISAGELRRGFIVSGQRNGSIPLFDPSALDQMDQNRNLAFEDARMRLRNRLIVLNMGMLLIAAGVSYVLAKHSLEPLEQAVEAQGRFTSDAAHELRTPLTVMKSEIQVALRQKKLSVPEAREILSSNLEEIAKLESLTAALLRLSQTQDNDRSYWESVKVSELITAATERVAKSADSKNIKLVTKLNSDVKVSGDQDQLTELLVTLLDNAIKYGNDSTSVSVSVDKASHQARIMVADKGLGIKATDLPLIFERFYRADLSRSGRNVAGYGLGLSLAKAIATAHGGTITAVSQLGKGSTFTVLLPLAG